jgi:hypothetical protein
MCKRSEINNADTKSIEGAWKAIKNFFGMMRPSSQIQIALAMYDHLDMIRKDSVCVYVKDSCADVGPSQANFYWQCKLLVAGAGNDSVKAFVENALFSRI